MTMEMKRKIFSENSKFISVLPTGEIVTTKIHICNNIINIRRLQIKRYYSFNEEKLGTGSIKINIVDQKALTDKLSRVYDTSSDEIDNDKDWNWMMMLVVME